MQAQAHAALQCARHAVMPSTKWQALTAEAGERALFRQLQRQRLHMLQQRIVRLHCVQHPLRRQRLQYEWVQTFAHISHNQACSR